MQVRLCEQTHQKTSTDYQKGWCMTQHTRYFTTIQSQMAEPLLKSRGRLQILVRCADEDEVQV